jgi:hypothetical protein
VLGARRSAVELHPAGDSVGMARAGRLAAARAALAMCGELEERERQVP